MRSGGSSNKPPAGIERDSEAQGLEGESGIGKVFQSTLILYTYLVGLYNRKSMTVCIYIHDSSITNGY